jgi:hypothetical protein
VEAGSLTDADADVTSPDAGLSSSVDAVAPDATGDDAPASPPQTNLRFAQLSPDLPPVDICIAPHGTALFQGPLLAGLGGNDAGGGDAAPPGLDYAQVSAYFSVAAGSYDVRIVAAGATDCSVALAPVPPSIVDASAAEGGFAEAGADAALTDAGDVDAADAGVADAGFSDLAVVDAAAFAPNVSSTVLIAGELSPLGTDASLKVTAITDDTALAGGTVALRAINAMPGAASLDFGLGSFASGWLPLLTDVAFASGLGQAAPSAGAVDAQGYLPIGPLSSQTVSARVSSGATGDAAIAKSMTIGAESIATVIAIGGRAGDTAHPASLLLCIDNEPSGGLLSDCSVAP